MAKMSRIAGVGAAALLVLLGVHNVSDAVTEEDIHYADRMLEEAGYSGPKRGFGDYKNDFESQIRAIRAVQDTAIRTAARDEGIAPDRGRELRDIYEQRKGECFDRSRAIEKLLNVIGLQTRHVSVYSTTERSALMAVLTPQNDSHALTEVKTLKGWMAVDPNVRWIGLRADREPVDAAGLRALDLATIQWDGDSAAVPHPIFRSPYVLVRGLYSRHGRFYPPFTPVPDINWRQFLQNFID